MKKTVSIIDLAMRYRQIVILVVATLMLFGAYALIVMPKQEFPAFTIRQGVVAGVYPGATSSEIEEQLAKPLEEFLFTYKEIKKAKTYSQSKEGIVYVFVELNDDVFNKDEVWSKIKHGLNGFKMKLPPGVLALIANDDFGDTSALLITLESETKTYRQLQNYLENLENRLRRIESVSNLRHYGLQNEQISIYIEKDKLANYGISLISLYKTLSSKGMAVPSGEIDNNSLTVPIHVNQPYQSEKDVEDQIVYFDASGNNIRLKDVARVVKEYPKPDSYILNNGKKCLVLSTEMREGFNIVQYGKDVDAVLQEFQQTLPDDVSIFRIADQSKVVDTTINTFLQELLIAIIAVILVIMILLPTRVAAVAASSIPISIFISLGLMFAFGIELNTVTLAALIVVLGMIVDNSVVIVDSYLEKIDSGMSRQDAATSSAKKYFRAILSATLAISLTFFPFLLTMKGQFRDFLLAFPWTTLIALGVSLAVAVLVIPFLLYFFIRKGLIESGGKPQKKTLLDRLQSGYEWLLEKVFQLPGISLSITILSVIIGGIMFASLPLRLMPIAERDQFTVEIYLPNGSSIEETKTVCDSLEKVLREDKRVVSVTSFLGAGSPRFHTTYAPKLGGKNFAQFIVNTTSIRATEDVLDDYTNKYANYFPNAYVKFKQLNYQTVESEFEIRLSGDSLNDLKRKAAGLIAELRKLDEPARIRTNFEEPLPTIEVTVDPVEASRMGVSEMFIGLGMASRFGGFNISTLWEGSYSIPLVLKTQWDTKYPTIEDVGNEYVPGLLSPAIPLRQIAKVSAGWQEGQIVRRNSMRTITIMMDIKRGEHFGTMQKKVDGVVHEYLAKTDMKDIKLSYGGVKENNSEVLPQIMGGLGIAIVIILFILIFHFRSIRLALIVFGACSLCYFGAALGMMIMGLDFSITAVLGIVSLIGIIVRNGIIMFDYTKELRYEGKSVYDAALEAGKRRMRPIFLTSAAASMGVVPMIISKSPLWCPMGTIICFGTLITMIFILTVFPLVYWITYRGQENSQKQPITNKESINR